MANITKKRQSANKHKQKKPITKQKQSNKSKSSESTHVNNQTVAIILFALSLLLLFVILLRGENLWNYLHTFITGLFGITSIAVPILLLYITISIALQKPINKVSTKIILMSVLIVLICSSVYIFSTNVADEQLNYYKQLKNLYINGTLDIGGGLVSGILGIPILVGVGSVGARILIVLLIFVVTMILTGITLPQLVRTFKKPIKVMQNSIDKRKNSIEEDLEYEKVLNKVKFMENIKNTKLDKKMKKRSSIDIPFKEDVANNFKDESGAEAAAKAYVEKRKKSSNNNIENELYNVSVNMRENKGLKHADYKNPPISLLEEDKEIHNIDITNELKTNGQILVDTLKSFGVQTKIINISRGPAVTRYELQPAAGVKISKITNLSDDIALNLAAIGVRIEAPIPGKSAVGIEVPNKTVNIVKMRDILSSSKFISSNSKITCALGRDIAGNVTLANLEQMPHLLIAGSTGSGKSVCINTLIISMLYKSTPDEVKFLMIDPKVVELGNYNGIPQLLIPVVTDPKKAAGALNWAVKEMLDRYKIFAEYGVRDLQSYNLMIKKYKGKPPKINKNIDTQSDDMVLDPLPQIVIIIDELADLMMAAPREVEDSICRLAQMARAAGMHLVIATQRPSVDVITGVIKANIPSRIAFAVSSLVDSRTILDSSGAEKLLGRGDMLFSPVGASKPKRVQGCFLSASEIERVVRFVKSSQNTEYDKDIIDQIEKITITKNDNDENITKSQEDDDMMDKAIRCVIESGQASTSLLQRRLRLGYARAGRIIDEMEQMGIVGPHEGSKPRKVLITNEQFLERNMQKFDDSFSDD